MTRARSEPDEPLRATTYQYGPQHMLFANREPWSELAHGALSRGIRLRIPHEYGEAWTLLCTNAAMGANEHRVLPLVRWLAENGRDLGARPPSIAERARAMGTEAYTAELGLSDYHTFNAQGNAFDPEILHVRLGATIATWLREPTHIARHAWVTPRMQWDIFHDVRRTAIAAGADSAEMIGSPFPNDIWEALIYHSLPAPEQPRPRRPRSGSPSPPAARRGRTGE